MEPTARALLHARVRAMPPAALATAVLVLAACAADQPRPSASSPLHSNAAALPSSAAESPSPEPTATPLDDPVAAPWAVVEMPQPPDAGYGGAWASDAAVGGPGLVAVGRITPCCADARYDDEWWRAVIWTSTDGWAWELLDDRDTFGKAGLVAVDARDGTLVTAGYEVVADDPISRPTDYQLQGTIWRSENGVDWSPVDGLAGSFRDVAATPWGWAVFGSDGRTPTVWTSTNLAVWQAHPLDGVDEPGDGHLVVDDAGRVLAVGCTRERATESGCAVTVHATTDGTTWRSTRIRDLLQVDTATTTLDGFVLFGVDDTGDVAVWRSEDGVRWGPVGHLPGVGYVADARQIGASVLLVGDQLVEGTGVAGAWRLDADGTVVELPLAGPAARSPSQARSLALLDDRVVVFGTSFVEVGGHPFAWIGERP